MKQKHILLLVQERATNALLLGVSMLQMLQIYGNLFERQAQH